MAEGATIGHLNFVGNLDQLKMDTRSRIGRANWITGYSVEKKEHFQHVLKRKSQLIMEEESTITRSHHIDCTDQVKLGKYATIAGYRSQILTHSICLRENRQDCAPVEIGSYSFVGTNCVILGGAKLPNKSALGASSLLRKSEQGQPGLYSGVPAIRVTELDREFKYFNRSKGRVD
ncbi:acyltransferase [Roseibacillus ishigakijimensis]|uniref:acyltransferase n=1 Tax=Roseibacillus ishigakijimensis TaxID=454146 RepID=UPI001908D153|nr:hypothetical protein [Roseibacillus ishigakijimensis]